MSVLGLEMETSSKNNINSKHQRHQIIRGKRTKRSRPLTAVTSSSSTGCTSGGNDAYFSIPSPASSGQNNSTCTEEDEDIDMANCLILLASCPKLIGQKFTETTTATTTAGKAGCYVYECKTCNRNFPSFQALGGHRASHKKPRVAIPGENNKLLNTTLINKEDQEDVQFNKVISPSIFVNKSLQSTGTNNNKAKVHECSICGSEFASGQALGGHMRRHRITTPPTNGNSTNIIDDDQKNKPIRNILQLDLNLPAAEDDHVDAKFPFVFSAPAPLVGCHY